jgi:hypothetical protein
LGFLYEGCVEGDVMSLDWLPNWRNKSEYPDPKQMNNLRWAWEFLRRNREYQQDYERLRVYTGGGPCFNGFRDEDSLRPLNEYAICNPPALENETKDEYIKRMANTPWRMTPLCAALAEKYGLNFPVLSDPSENAPNNWFYFAKQTIPQITHAYYEDWLKHVPAVKPSRISEVVVTFDLERPLLPQIESIKADLVLKQQSMTEDGLLQPIIKRNGIKNFVSYLQMLDAEANGVKVREMAEVIFPYLENSHQANYLGDQTVRNHLKAAKGLRDSHYRYLTLNDPLKLSSEKFSNK